MEIFVGCSSSEKLDKKYIDLAHKLGLFISKNNHTLIFGSSDKGMMGELYKTVRNNKCKVISVIPKEYRGMLSSVESDKVIEVPTTSDQLKTLVNMGDITIILPGSYGTLSELMTSIQCKKLKEHHKPIFIINIDGFYDDIINIFDKIYKEKFDFYDKNKLYKVINSVEELEKYIKE